MTSWIGARVPRVEDERFLRGEGRFVADLKMPFMLEAVIVRSPQAHARIARIDTAPALACEGVTAVVTGADLPPDLPPIPIRIPSAHNLVPYLQYPMARDVVRYFGEPVAVVVAASRALAEDAAEHIHIEWEPLPVVSNAAAGERPDAPSLFPAGNVPAKWGFDIGAVDAARAAASVTVSDRFTVQRDSAMPLETRGLLAAYDKGRGMLEVFGPTKVPHFNRGVLAAMLRMPESSLRLAEPDVGGSFGVRGEFYPEDFLIPWLALRLQRPVRWIEDRVEHFAAINHSRESEFVVTATADAGGRVTAFDVHMRYDMGGYMRTHGDVVPAHAAATFVGPYSCRNYRIDAAAVLSNKTPTGTMRGPGLFEANFVREQILDRLADKLGLDPAEFRRRNLIQPDQLPWRLGTVCDGRPQVYDVGNYPLVYEKAVAAAWNKPLAPNTGSIRRGRGITTLVEPSGLGPFEGARIEIDPLGFVNLACGSSNQGQGLETMLAQIAAETLTIPVDRIRVRHGDTAIIPFGGGTYASRTTVLGGAAVHTAAKLVRDKAIRAAARKLEVAEQDLTLTDGRVHLVGAPQHGLDLGLIARMLQPGVPILTPWPEDMVAEDHDGLTGTSYIRSVPDGNWVFAVHVADVAVDIETGEVEVERYFVACDIGRAVNPMLVEGQLVGAIIQGLGGTLLHELTYDAQGQLQTGTFMDYPLPSVHNMPKIELLVMEEVKATGNPLGVRGVGEVGITGVPPTIANAITRALGLKRGIVDLPITPERVLAAIIENAA